MAFATFPEPISPQITTSSQLWSSLVTETVLQGFPAQSPSVLSEGVTVTAASMGSHKSCREVARSSRCSDKLETTGLSVNLPGKNVWLPQEETPHHRHRPPTPPSKPKG